MSSQCDLFPTQKYFHYTAISSRIANYYHYEIEYPLLRVNSDYKNI